MVVDGFTNQYKTNSNTYNSFDFCNQHYPLLNYPDLIALYGSEFLLKNYLIFTQCNLKVQY